MHMDDRRVLEDEGCMGTTHLGFGSNLSFGGVVDSPNHLDLVFRDPTVTVDGRTILQGGAPCRSVFPSFGI